QIAIEKEKERKRLEQEKREREQKERERKERERAEKDKKERELKEREQKEREQKEREERRLAEQKKAEQERQKKQAEERRKAEEARRTEDLRQEQLRRIQGLANATGSENARGTAERSSGPSGSYAGRVAARVKPNIVYPEVVSGNPRAEVEVRAAPDGTITGIRLTQSSGNKAWDDAVVRALQRTETLPRDVDGRVPSSLVIGFRPQD
ncbi:MAG: TonB family protein, partial [Burkholderiaceae bacterium]